MADMMMFPDTWEEFEEQYGITDREEIYTNGARLIPSFRVKQWLDHIADRKTVDLGNGFSITANRNTTSIEGEPQTDCSWK